MSIESAFSSESTPILKEDVIAMLKLKGPNDPEASAFLDEFMSGLEDAYIKEGREGARIESMREKANTLCKAGFIAEALGVMNDVATLSYQEGDEFLYDDLDTVQILEEKLIASGSEADRDIVFRSRFVKTMSYVDYNFRDPAHFIIILNNLFRNLEETTEDENNPDRVGLRKEIEVAIEKVRGLIDSNQS